MGAGFGLRFCIFCSVPPMAKSRSSRRRLPASEAKTALEHYRQTCGRGELSEFAFVHKAASLGFGVAKPCSATEPFDFILISRDPPEEAKLWRVQVKSTTGLIRGLYHVNTIHSAGGCRRVYQPSEIDFLAAHIVPDDVWFIFPIHAITSRTSVGLLPKHSKGTSIFEAYREAWHLFCRRR
jgi:PD-(D/E)XK endonuclease